MDKINFQNLPNTTTPVNATNLNLLQTNVENECDTKTKKIDFNIEANSSITLTIDGGGSIAFLLTGKGQSSDSHLLWFIVNYSSGGSSRFKMYNLLNFNNADITTSLNGRELTITNSLAGTYKMSITYLVVSDVVITIATVS